jgi:hypothetical protein
MNETITVSITDEDIRDGFPNHWYQNPLARALIRDYGMGWEVKTRVAVNFAHGTAPVIGTYKIGPEVKRFLANFNGGEPVQPMQVTLELVKGILAERVTRDLVIIRSIRPKPGRVCSLCMKGIPNASGPLTFADRKGSIYCEGCSPDAGLPSAGMDCQICYDGCDCFEGAPGCEHFLCQAFAVNGIIPDNPDKFYASCPGAPQRCVEVRELATAFKFAFFKAFPQCRRHLYDGTEVAS